jgi:hypothetical protein
MQTSTLTAAAMATASAAKASSAVRIRNEEIEMKKLGAFWPNGARLVVSISMQFEAGAQPERGAESPFPIIDAKYPDLPVAKWYDYGFKEGSTPISQSKWASQSSSQPHEKRNHHQYCKPCLNPVVYSRAGRSTRIAASSCLSDTQLNLAG